MNQDLFHFLSHLLVFISIQKLIAQTEVVFCLIVSVSFQDIYIYIIK